MCVVDVVWATLHGYPNGLMATLHLYPVLYLALLRPLALT